MKQAERQDIATEYVRKHGLNSSNVTKEHLETLYFDMKLSLNIIAEQFQRSPRTISKWLKKYGINTRSVGEARSVHLEQDFFKSWSPSMAWALGLCFTDGYFRKNQIRLMLNDQETLVKVKYLVGPYLTIYKRPQPYDKSNVIYSLTFGNEEMAGDLESLGITNRKSLTMKFPDAPKPFIRDFIRGCWDGDGGFSLTGGKLFAHYTCGSKEFIDKVALELFVAGIRRRILRRSSTEDIVLLHSKYSEGPYPLRVYKRRNAKAYDIRFASDEQLVALYKFFYMNADPAIYMARKHNILFEYVKRLI